MFKSLNMFLFGLSQPNVYFSYKKLEINIIFALLLQNVLYVKLGRLLCILSYKSFSELINVLLPILQQKGKIKDRKKTPKTHRIIPQG